MGEADVTLYAAYKTSPDIEMETYGILYDANGAGSGTVPEADNGAEVKIRSVSGNVGSLLKTGYRFGGWNTKADGTGTTYQKADELILAALLTLYARWLPTCTLTYDLNEGFLLLGADNVDTFVTGSQVQLRDSMIALPFSFQLGSGVFVGWNTKADGTGSAFMPGDVVELDTDWTLYPKWVDGSGLSGIRYLGNGNDAGTLPTIIYCLSGMTLIVPGQGTLERTGYRFVGWADEDEALYLPDATFDVPGHDLVLRAVWVPVCHVTYDTGGFDLAVPSPTVIHTPGETVRLPGTFGEKVIFSHDYLYAEGYFVGWSTQPDGAGTVRRPGFPFPVTGDVTLYAVYETQKPVEPIAYYPVTYSVYGSLSGVTPVDDKTYAPGTTVTVKDWGTITGNGEFVGWQRGDGSGTTYAFGSTFTYPEGVTSLVLFPKFVPNFISQITENMLIYEDWGADGGTAPDDERYYGENATVAANPGGLVKSGYHFGGWKDANGTAIPEGTQIWFNTDDPNDSLPDSPTVYLYPIWVAGERTHKVTYTEGGMLQLTQWFAEAEFFEVETEITPYVGYFMHWNTRSDGTGTSYAPSDFIQMGTGNVALYAIYSAIPSYQAYFMDLGESGRSANVGRSFHTGDLVTAVHPYTMRGAAGTYFAGWQPEGTDLLYQPGETFVMGTSNVFLLSVFLPYNDAYAVTYSGDGQDSGTVPPNRTAYAGETFSLPSLNTVGVGVTLRKSGKVLAGWFADGLFHGMGATFTMPSRAVEVKAVWAARLQSAPGISAVFDGNGSTSGAVPTSMSLAVGESFSLPENSGNLQRTGFVFSGWSDGQVHYEVGDLVEPLDASLDDLYFSAVWLPAHGVTYQSMESGGGSVPLDDAVYVEGQSVSLSRNTGDLTREHAWFAGWCVDGVLYLPGDTVPMGEVDLVATAVWASEPLSDDASLSALSVGGTAVEGFTADDFEYSVELPSDTKPDDAAAIVAATAGFAGAGKDLVQADEFPGDATVDVVSESGDALATYTVHLTLAVDPTATMSPAPTGAPTPTSTVTAAPTGAPTPTAATTPTAAPTATPTGSPSPTTQPTASPTPSVEGTFVFRTLTDKATGLTVSGVMHPQAELTVLDLILVTDAASEGIRAKKVDVAYTLLFDKDVSLSKGFTGRLGISFPVDAKWEGRTITLLHNVDGVLETLSAEVCDGMATFEVGSLSSFALFAPSDAVGPMPDRGLSFLWWLLSALLVVCLAVLIVVWRRKK